MPTPLTLALILLTAPVEPEIRIGHRVDFFALEPGPVHFDAASRSSILLLHGGFEPGGSGLRCLADGALPLDLDQPGGSCSFDQSATEGWLLFDLGSDQDIERVSTYSHHSGPRSAQNYTLFLAAGEALPELPRGSDEGGFSRVARVDTRGEHPPGGSVAAHVFPRKLGRARYVLLVTQPATGDGAHTPWCEIDIVTQQSGPGVVIPAEELHFVAATSTARHRATFDLRAAPDLSPAVRTRLARTVSEWYPHIEQRLPSQGYRAPADFTVQFLPADQMGDMAPFPAYASGTHIVVNATWYAENLEGEAIGCVVHELVHVVQQYTLGQGGPESKPTPVWLTEGIADYIRWFLFEPETGGALIGPGYLPHARHDQSYRVTANFLDYVIRTHGDDVLTRLNHAARWGAYDAELWVELTGKAAAQLEADWLADLREKLER